MSDFTALVIGGGPAGWAAACLLEQEGIATAIASAPAKPDVRTVALMQPSINLLRYAGVWTEALKQHCAPLKHLHIVDDTDNLVSAPALEFSSRELDLAEFGWNVPIAHLVPALQDRAAVLGVRIIEATALKFEGGSGQTIVHLDNGLSLSAKAVIAADGMNSTIRKDAGIAIVEKTFEQTALATSFSHSGPHENISIELHKRGGPFTTVPLPGNRSSLVWMNTPEFMMQLAALSSSELAVEIQLASHGRLGLISDIGPRAVFPMRTQRATTYARHRAFLVGEAAHAMPPIGAQGLNMSLRDAGHLVDVMLAATDPGSDSAMRDYDRLRRSDVESRLSLVGAMNNSLLSDLMPISVLRAAGLASLNLFPPLRHFALRKGIAQSENLPFAMRAAG
jgi:2-octaprenyl-6-methoxyphenol hydroxylase